MDVNLLRTNLFICVHRAAHHQLKVKFRLHTVAPCVPHPSPQLGVVKQSVQGRRHCFRISWLHRYTGDAVERYIRNARIDSGVDDGLTGRHRFQLNYSEALPAFASRQPETVPGVTIAAAFTLTPPENRP